MQLTSLASNVQLANVGSTTGFTMEANEFSFRVLSDGLYQNKIGSMVRETACNGLDSHTMAGKVDTPIRIHLPDTYEPWYSVQDFGIGLDDLGVRDTFATYFRSTKRTDNSAVGAFGLGSKTPFAYTDAFTIVAVKDGRKRQYSAFIAEDGKPSITNMGGEFSEAYLHPEHNVEILDQWDVTDEGNGVTIIVPVTSSSDFYRFRTEVQNQLTFFPVKPEIVNGEVAWKDWSMAGAYVNLDRVMVGDRASAGAFTGLWIVQGPVGYKADVELIKQHVGHDNRELLDIVGECGILRFNLGEVEVTPSREGLSYSKRTLNAIETLLDETRATLKSRIQAEVDALGDAWQTATGINANNMLRRLSSITKTTFEAEGYYRTGSYYYLDLEKIADIEGKKTGADATDADADDAADTYVVDGDDAPPRTAVAGLLNLQFRLYVNKAKSMRSRVRKWSESGVGRHAKADSTFTVLVRDTADKPVVRIREFLSGISYYSHAQVYVLQTRDGKPVSADELAAIKARIGESWEPAYMSEVELPTRATESRAGRKPPTAFTWNPGDDYNDCTEWERETEKLKEFESAYYVTMYRNDTGVASIDSVVFEMAKKGLLDRPIMAIRARDEVRIKDNPEWIPLNVKAREVVDAVKANKTFVNAYLAEACRVADINCIEGGLIEVLRNACADGKISASSPLHNLFNGTQSFERIKARADARGYSAFARLALRQAGTETYSKVQAIQKSFNNRLQKLQGQVTDRYPLLAFMRNSYINGKWMNVDEFGEHIIAYINATEAGANPPA